MIQLMVKMFPINYRQSSILILVFGIPSLYFSIGGNTYAFLISILSIPLLSVLLGNPFPFKPVLAFGVPPLLLIYGILLAIFASIQLTSFSPLIALFVLFYSISIARSTYVQKLKITRSLIHILAISTVLLSYFWFTRTPGLRFPLLETLGSSINGLSSLVSVTTALLLYRLELEGKNNPLLFLFLILPAILSTSRSAIIIAILCFTFSLLLNLLRPRSFIKKSIEILFLGIIIVLVFNYIFSTELLDQIVRSTNLAKNYDGKNLNIIVLLQDYHRLRIAESYLPISHESGIFDWLSICFSGNQLWHEGTVANYYSGNLHNSFFRANIYGGSFYFLFMMYLLWKCAPRGNFLSLLSYILAVFLIVLRASTDSFLMGTPADVLVFSALMPIRKINSSRFNHLIE